MKPLVYGSDAVKILQRNPADQAVRIRSKIKQFAADPASLANNVKALKGSPFIRRRVGDWRVLMDDRGHVLGIVRIGASGGVYD